MRNLIKVLSLCGLLALATPAFAQIHVDVHFGAPPPPRYEVVVPAPTPSAVWVPGNYAFDVRLARYVWVPGRWQVPPTPYHVWVAPRYVRRGDHYDYYEGTWHDNGKHKGWEKQEGHEAHGGRER
ncbi:MAG: hypothetical protein Q8922_07145 [Bacteroidota bacterium]|nr:hypothetical protein [Bacteroidota bacterium]MDP4233999.1 hypothetical protein [Bacteroidota bacterium]MDP4242866.1 hypothetical protein [Bacteroidota bacterium]MDP4287696.1 hypothetical protein [Bacteroidota bacterium]